MQYDQVRAVLEMWLGAVLTVLVVAPTIASAYPTEPVTLVVPFRAGSAPDTTIRVLAEEAERDLGQKLVILNRPGAGGAIGVRAVVQAAPDGYTIGMAAVAVLTLQPLVMDAFYGGPAIVERLVAAFKKAVESEAFRDYADRGGLLVRYLGPQELAERLRADAMLYRQVVEEFGWAKKK